MVFTKKRFQGVMPLVFLEFVTNRVFSSFVPLSDFYKSSISGSCAIRLFHRLRNIRLCDIKYAVSRLAQLVVCRRKAEKR